MLPTKGSDGALGSTMFQVGPALASIVTAGVPPSRGYAMTSGAKTRQSGMRTGTRGVRNFSTSASTSALS